MEYKCQPIKTKIMFGYYWFYQGILIQSVRLELMILKLV